MDQLADALEKLESQVEAERLRKDKEKQEQAIEDDEIWTLSFAEFQDRSLDKTCRVKIKGQKVIVLTNDEDLDEQNVITSGILVEHKSGRTIIANDESDANLDEVGGCTDGPLVIDLENRVVWTC